MFPLELANRDPLRAAVIDLAVRVSPSTGWAVECPPRVSLAPLEARRIAIAVTRARDAPARAAIDVVVAHAHPVAPRAIGRPVALTAGRRASPGRWVLAIVAVVMAAAGGALALRVAARWRARQRVEIFSPTSRPTVAHPARERHGGRGHSQKPLDPYATD
jgi:hypothetical protein